MLNVEWTTLLVILRLAKRAEEPPACKPAQVLGGSFDRAAPAQDDRRFVILRPAKRAEGPPACKNGGKYLGGPSTVLRRLRMTAAFVILGWRSAPKDLKMRESG